MTLAIAVMVALAPAAAGADAKAVTYVVVFEFACPDGAVHGRQLADSVRIRLRRHKEYSVIDRLTTAELTPAGGVSLKTPDEKIIKLLKEQVGAHVAVVGHVQKVGRSVRAEVRWIDITPKKPATWTKVFSDETERARGEIARQVVEAIRGKTEWKPPEYGDEAEPEKPGK
ncbi:unnamed protein product, partial [marine sediment metagenome]